MPLDDFDDERDEFRQPLPRDDRLWLHPSELGADRPPAPVALGHSERSRRRNLVASGTVVLGAAAVIGLVFLASTMRETPSPTTLTLRPATSPTALAQQSLVRIDAGDGAAVPARSGTALVLRPDGYLLTSVSVIAAGAPLFAALPDGRRLPAAVVGADKVSGLAVVRIEAAGLPVTATGSPADLSAGDLATAVGAAGTPMATGRITEVHAVDTAAAVSDTGALDGLIAVDSPSASTGAAESAVLVDSRGRVTAVCLWPAYEAEASGDSPAAAGTATPVSVTKMSRGYAIPIDQARATADELIATGQATHPWLGVRGTDVEMSSAPATGPTAGAQLTLVQPGSPAARAGLQAGDVVTAVGKDSIGSMADLVAEIQAHPPGSAMLITYSRAGKPHTTKAILEVMPS